jgi:hypothetical protein
MTHWCPQALTTLKGDEQSIQMTSVCMFTFIIFIFANDQISSSPYLI